MIFKVDVKMTSKLNEKTERFFLTSKRASTKGEDYFMLRHFLPLFGV